ncbi:MAG: S46 family peptidase, partial [Lysobacteraceae bacterium]
MPRRPLAAALSLALATSLAHADEGMWMPSQLPQLAKELKAAGFKGDPKALADLTSNPMAAVVQIPGCTASFVSAQGLVVTNHHCALGAIQLNSTPERNLIEDGFIAATQADEVPAGPAARVWVTVGFDKVTDRILAQARGKTGRAYYNAVDGARKAAVAACEADAGHRCSVVDMYYGSDFYLIKQMELKDVRLVYAPPRAIGNYGDEIDNFMWPRHTGDFSFYRAYVGKDGKPAAYSTDNVPYQPPAFLKVSTAAVKAGDFAMLAGYPGTTFRHRTASEFEHQIDWSLPARVDVLSGLIATIEGATRGDKAKTVLYASTVASNKNNLKRAQGELEGLR